MRKIIFNLLASLVLSSSVLLAQPFQQDIFIADNLHLNAKGYQIWQKAFAPYLIRN